MILKLQRSRAGEQGFLFYNENRTILKQFFDTQLDKESISSLLRMMRLRPKIFVNAEIVDGEIVVMNEAPYQEW